LEGRTVNLPGYREAVLRRITGFTRLDGGESGYPTGDHVFIIPYQPYWEPIRNDRRFQAMMRTMGL